MPVADKKGKVQSQRERENMHAEHVPVALRTLLTRLPRADLRARQEDSSEGAPGAEAEGCQLYKAARMRKFASQHRH